MWNVGEGLPEPCCPVVLLRGTTGFLAFSHLIILLITPNMSTDPLSLDAVFDIASVLRSFPKVINRGIPLDPCCLT